ncbi:hydroxyectoine utilization dehydratase EutB [Denitromonas iodatirespirans]|uniref:Hydroxyectoine utilization dehydratase EutB n=1 Tax=Denitromonas iodatirespirans TaxID=2795389 RepID=A0A944HD49_DENI1|nr:hydroxyectoine utilization dehydratase EutB [Denitromonas iodatirespirans]MBT0963367.1 hydroxyectoine utilization dehydratase EutB [Denitromonas iodatirespirans]
MTDDIRPIDIYRARHRLRGHVLHTQLLHSPSLSEHTGGEVHLKLECRQITGSFKLRGATNALLCLDDDARARGVIAVSTGNHGRALAYAAHRLGVRAVICMSKLVPSNKVEAIRALGAEVHIVGNSQDEADVEVARLVRDEGLTLLPPFDHPDIIAGQGTVGLELLDDLPSLDTVLVPLSGGGLLAGVALALKRASPQIRVIGVTMERGCAMHASLAAGKPVQVEELETLADSLGGGIGLDNRYTFHMAQTLVDDVVLVGEDEIAAAIRHAYAREQIVIEGSGAVGIAALLTGRLTAPGTTAVLVSGSNIDMALHRRIVCAQEI